MSNAKMVEINLDKKRNLLLNMNSMCAFEDATGKNFFEFSRSMKDMNVKDLRAFLWSALIHEDKALTLDMVGAMIRIDNMGEIQSSLLKVQELNAPEVEKGEGADSAPLPQSPQG